MAGNWILLWLVSAGLCFVGAGCSALWLPYEVTKGTVTGSVWAVKTGYAVTAGTAKVVYKIGEFSFDVAKAPLDWLSTHEEIEHIDGLPPKEAIRQGRVKNTPYSVNGKTYYPMSVEEARNYKQSGTASWYGYETPAKEGGRMTANGEAFDPNGLTAAHKYLPLPSYVRVTNLKNGASVIVRVNDRGPFPTNSASERVIDLSMGAAKRLGFYAEGTAPVEVQALQVDDK